MLSIPSSGANNPATVITVIPSSSANAADEIQKIDALYTNLKVETSEEYSLYHNGTFDKKLIVNTPLHDAAAAGETLLAMEIATLKPSFARKLNGDGLSPMHLALVNRHIETARSLLTVDPELVCVKGKYRMTPLHYAAAMDQTEILAEFLMHCPSAIKDLSSACESTLHIAVNNRNVEACKVILGWLQKVEIVDTARVANWKDANGNTVLHIATSTNQLEVMRLFTPYISAYSKNLQGKSCVDLWYDHHIPGHHCGWEVKRILVGGCKLLYQKYIKELSHAEYLSRGVDTFTRRFISRVDMLFGKALPMELRNVYLVVAGLFIVATYQAILSPPGGYSQGETTATAFGPSPMVTGYNDQQIAGKMIMSGWYRIIFIAGNTSAFLMSLILITYLVIRLPASTFLITSSVCLAVTYFSALLSNGDAADIGYSFMGMLLLECIWIALALFCKMKQRYLKPEEIRGRIYSRAIPL